MCLSPVSISRTYLGRRVVSWAPCGKCAECIKDKQNESVIKTLEEVMKVKGNVYFLTLTYSDDNVPLTVDEDGELIDEETGEILSTLKSLDNKDITNWKKRCKRYIQYHFKRNCQFSYLICGEYGPQTHRPHYHALFIGISPEDMEIFKQDWERNNGYTCVKQVSRFDIERTARYVSKYITKMRDLEDPNVMNGKVAKPRKMSSIGYGMPSKERWSRMKIDIMGKDYSIEELKEMTQSGKSMKNAIKLADKISKSLKYKQNGKEYKLPAYYKKKMLYYKDDTGKIRATEICGMVTHSLVSKVQSDYSRKLCQLADQVHAGEDYESMCKVAGRLQAIEEGVRLDREKAYLETNIAALRKSIF